jgi:hypothetical protein
MCSTCGFKIPSPSDTGSGVSDGSQQAAKASVIGKLFNIGPTPSKPSDSGAEKPVLG